MTTKLCKDCTNWSGNYQYPRCHAPELTSSNPVTGLDINTDCYPERRIGVHCGPEGKLFIAIMVEAA